MRPVVVALCFTLVAFPTSAQESRAISIGERGSLRSVGEDREYWVCLPASDRDSTYAPEHYPVVYLLDGNAYFHAASGVVEVMS